MGNFYFFLISTLAFVGHVCGEILMPAECEGRKYCSIKPDIYDTYQSDIDHHLKKIKFRGGDVPEGADDIITYSGDDLNCEAKSYYTKPYIIKVTKNQTESNRLVVQSSQNFQQTILVTECRTKGASCFQDVMQAQANSFTSACAEVSTTVTLYLYEPNQGISAELIEIPVGCACNIEDIDLYDEFKKNFDYK